MAIKNDKLTVSVMTELYQKYEDKAITTGEFKQYCISLIERSKQPEHPIKRDLMRATNKSILVFKTNNFIMAGHGLGVR
jgi:hypothetical protein|tara:strand:+ start:3819 stop:4055 length:237 start_codon:yes stop_codon:yes gene_type:complete